MDPATDETITVPPPAMDGGPELPTNPSPPPPVPETITSDTNNAGVSAAEESADVPMEIEVAPEPATETVETVVADNPEPVTTTTTDTVTEAPVDSIVSIPVSVSEPVTETETAPVPVSVNIPMPEPVVLSSASSLEPTTSGISSVLSVVTAASTMTSSIVGTSTASGCPAILEALNGGETHPVMDISDPSPITTEVPMVTTNQEEPEAVSLQPVENGTARESDSVSAPSPTPTPELTLNKSPPPPAVEEEDDWYAACSDEEKYNPAKRDNGTWEPDPKDIVELLSKVARGDATHLQWRCPGRRSPTPERDEEAMDAKDNTEEESKEEERVEETKFDFDEDFGESEKPLAITPRRTPGGPAKTPKSNRRVASLDKIMNDIRRHKKIDDGAKKGEKAALDTTPRTLNKLKLSPKRLDASS